jgi:hypothetical protein
VLDVEEGDDLTIPRRELRDCPIEIALRFLFLDPLLAALGEGVGKLRSDAGLGSVVAPAFT